MKTIIDKNTGKEITISDESYESLFLQKNKRWKPYHDDKYYFINRAGEASHTYMDGDPIDNYNYHTCNMFKTLEEAEEKLKAIEKKYDIINRIEELNDGWEPDWGNDDSKYSLFIDFSRAIHIKRMPDELYFKTTGIGYTLISEFGDDLKYLFTL
jgi:hypothetical protein